METVIEQFKVYLEGMKKEIDFNTKISEITSISLEHNIKEIF